MYIRRGQTVYSSLFVQMNSCLEVNTDVHCLEGSELFLYVCLFNLLEVLWSEKPPEAVLERVIFKSFPGGACPQTPLDFGVLRTPSSETWPYRFYFASYSPDRATCGCDTSIPGAKTTLIRLLSLMSWSIKST